MGHEVDRGLKLGEGNVAFVVFEFDGRLLGFPLSGAYVVARQDAGPSVIHEHGARAPLLTFTDKFNCRKL